jgi:hypothetical protein
MTDLGKGSSTTAGGGGGGCSGGVAVRFLLTASTRAAARAGSFLFLSILPIVLGDSAAIQGWFAQAKTRVDCECRRRKVLDEER